MKPNETNVTKAQGANVTRETKPKTRQRNTGDVLKRFKASVNVLATQKIATTEETTELLKMTRKMYDRWISIEMPL